MGTWIEIHRANGVTASSRVVPYVGTWIEILNSWAASICNLVVPYVGTWIEIPVFLFSSMLCDGRSLRGNVDRNTSIPLVTEFGNVSFPTWERG